MRFISNLYLGESVKDHRKRLIHKLNAGKGSLFCYILAIVEDSPAKIQLFSSELLRQPMFRPRDFLIVGLAGSKEEGIALIQEITEDTYRDTGSCDIREYLLSKE